MRALEGPFCDKKVDVFVYGCSTCSWFFVAEAPTTEAEKADLRQRAEQMFQKHRCDEFPYP